MNNTNKQDRYFQLLSNDTRDFWKLISYLVTQVCKGILYMFSLACSTEYTQDYLDNFSLFHLQGEIVPLDCIPR